MNKLPNFLNTNAFILLNDKNIANTEQYMKSTYMGRLFFPIVTRLSIRTVFFIKEFLNKIGCAAPQAWISSAAARCGYIHDKKVLLTYKQDLSEKIKQIKADFERAQIVPLITKKKDGSSPDISQKFGALKTLATKNKNRKIFWSALNDKLFQKRLYSKISEENQSFPKESTIELIQTLVEGTYLDESVAAYILSRSSDFTEEVVKNTKNWFCEHSLEVVLHDVVVNDVNTFVKTAYIQSLLSPSDDQDVIDAFEHAREIGPAIKSMEALTRSFPNKKNGQEEVEITKEISDEFVSIVNSIIPIYKNTSSENVKKYIEKLFDKINSLSTGRMRDVSETSSIAFRNAYNELATALGRVSENGVGKIEIPMDTENDQNMAKKVQEESDAVTANMLQMQEFGD